MAHLLKNRLVSKCTWEASVRQVRIFISALMLLAMTRMTYGGDFGSDDPTLVNIKQEGQLVTVRIVRGEPLRIFVLGREEAKVNMSDLAVTVRRLKPYPGKILSLTKDGNFYTVKDPSDRSLSDIEIKAKARNGEETFYFHIDNKSSEGGHENKIKN
jgi:hypothetical protein